jgi:hypothetical protein
MVFMEIINLWIIVIGAVGAFFILFPFFSKKIIREDRNDYNEWQLRKEQIFTQLSDLEYDYRMNKLSEEDYKSTKTELVAKAGQFVTAPTIDHVQIAREVDEEIKHLLENNLKFSGKEEHYE